MSFVGNSISHAAFALYVLMAVVSACLLIFHFQCIRHLRLVAVFLLPVISFVICFENTVLSFGDNVSPCSVTAGFTYVFHSLKVPLLVDAVYESAFRLFELRFAHFLCFPFDQGPDYNKNSAKFSLILVRLLSCGLLAINLVANFERNCNNNDSRGGYIYLSKHREDIFAWLPLIPPIVLSIMALAMSSVVMR